MTEQISLLVPRSDQKSDFTDVGGVPCQGVMFGSLRDAFRMWRGQMSFVVVAVDGGYVIRAVLGNQKAGVFVMAEHSKQMRVFKKADSALAMCRRLGLSSVKIDL